MGAEWADVIIALAVGVVGLYLVNSIRRQTRVKRETEAVTKRFELYAKLWAATQIAAPMNERVGTRPLSPYERQRLVLR